MVVQLYVHLQTLWGYADLNFVVVGDTATLIWAGSAWAVLASHNAASDSGIVDIAN